jgi:cytochrome c oxidase subunit III
MATTVHEPPKLERRPATSGGSGGFRDMVPAGGLPRTVQRYAPPPASTGIWVVLAAIGMSFAALTSALVVRKGGATDWRHFTLPSVLYFNTLLLIASSVTLEVSRKRIASFMSGGRTGGKPVRWLYLTLGLGFAFVAGQYIAWWQLNAQGLYLATNPASSFFYVFTAAHALHLIGGLGGMVRVIAKLNHSSLRKATMDATSRYWHFMDVLWVYLLLLLWMKL